MSHVACHQQYARTEGVHVSIKSAPVHILAQSSIVLQYNNTNLTMVAKVSYNTEKQNANKYGSKNRHINFDY